MLRAPKIRSQNRYVYVRNQTILVVSFAAIVLALTIAAATAQTKDSARALSVQAAGFAESGPVRDLPKVEATQKAGQEKEINPENREIIRHIDPRVKPSADAALSSDTKAFRNAPTLNAPPAPTVSFEGISEADTVPLGQGFLPPDTNGAAGPNHYVQTVNVTFRVWDKAGNPLTNTATIGSLFATLAGPCAGTNDGDPIVLYDQLADRWIISQFCVSVANPNNHQLIAVSKTGDPTGSYYLYDFMMPNNSFNDYPHFGVWPDAYYMTDNQFNQAGTAFQGTGVFAFERAKMLAGDPTASFVYFNKNDNCSLSADGSTCTFGGMLPACLDGLTPPPAGAPAPFAMFDADEFGAGHTDSLRLFDFHADFGTPANSTFIERTGSPLAVAAFDPREVPTGSRNVVPQPAGSALDVISDRLMFRLAYRNFGSTESLIANHSVNAATNPSFRAGVRFYELTRSSPAAAFTIAEQQTFAPADTENRWMGSGAMNFQGDIAVGYSVSSSTVFPSIRYAAKLNTDPPGSGLAQGEQTIITGAGAQTSSSGRWGDYSDMTVDPSDDCSFWYTQEYYPATGASTWHTRIAKLVVGTLAVSPRGTISGTIANCQGGAPIANAMVQLTGGYSRATAANGTYSATVIPGTYNVTATAPGYDTAALNGLVVSNGGNAIFNACLNGILKQPVADTATVTADNCNSNGTIDPNETVTVSLGIKNTGTLNTANLVATLQATGGVTSPSGPQTYGVVVAGGATVFKSFTFTSGNIACGSTLIATLQLQDGATNLGTITYNFVTGVVSGSLYATGNIAVPIPDNTTVDIPLNVPDAMTISDVNVSFRLNHTFDGDLVISLVHPDNTVVPLVTNRGTSGDNFGTGTNDCSGTPTVIDDQATTPISTGTAPFAGSFTPEAPLSVLNGKPSNGTWKLRVQDTAAGDTGTVGCFKLELNRHFVCCGAQIAAAPPAVVTAESFTPFNSAPDPGETVTVSLPLVNTGGTNTSNLVATLQATGGVTSPSGPQNYGVVVGGGSSVARSFTFTANGTCGSNITLTLALQDGANNLGMVTFTMQLGGTTSATTSFSNTTSITIPASGTGATTGAPATPYPSNIVVSGLTGTISKVTIGLNGLNHTFPADVDFLLVGPGGQTLIITSDVIGGTDWVNTNYVLDDAAAGLIPSSGTPVSGTFKPTNYGTGDVFPAPAPQVTYNNPGTAGTATFASVFNGTNPNGTWSLYVVDDASADIGTMSGGWTINITTAVPTCNTGPPAIINGPPPSPVIVGSPYSFTYVPGGNPTPTFSITGGVLPPGLSLSSAGVLSGTATSGGNGTFPNITVTATNGILPNATQNFSLTAVTRAANYIASFGLTGGNAAFLSDFDHDSLVNLMEYALGVDPTIASLTGLPVVTLKDYSGTKYLSMTFHRSSLATDLTYIGQSSGDLVTWTDLGTSSGGAVTSGVGFVGETGSAPNFTVEVRDIVADDPNANPPPKRFMRLRVTSP